MLGSILVAAAVLVVHFLFTALTDNLLIYFLLWNAYFHLSNWLHTNELLLSHRLRASTWLTDIVRRLYFHGNGSETLLARWYKKQMASKKVSEPNQYMFACEPHGSQCLHMVFMFAAYGSAVTRGFGDRLRVAAHGHVCRIPLVRDLLSAFGVISVERAPFEKSLATGHSVALVPSGMLGKRMSMLQPNNVDTNDNAVPANETNNLIVYHRKNKYGFVKLAIKHNVSIVPVLCLNEHAVYDRYLTWTNLFPLVVNVGKYLLFPKQPLRMLIGEPIHTTNVNCTDRGAVADIARQYYQQLESMHKNVTVVEIIE